MRFELTLLCFLSFFCLLTMGENAQQDYMVIDLAGEGSALHYPCRYSMAPPDLDRDSCRTTELWLRRVPAGTFEMGSPETEIGYSSREKLHKVTLSQGFYIGIFTITGFQWEVIMGTKPGQFSDPAKYACRPVDCISYDMIRGDSPQGGGGWPGSGHAVDASSFLGILRQKTGLLFDLPTEAQWEYACRAGSSTAFNTGKGITAREFCPNLSEAGRFSFNGGIVKLADGTRKYGGTAAVGSYTGNAWGVYDMHGNVWEWCLDWHNAETTDIPVVDPWGAQVGIHRQLRGGAWSHHALHCRAAYRTAYRKSNSVEYGSGIGFRVILLTTGHSPEQFKEGRSKLQK